VTADEADEAGVPDDDASAADAGAPSKVKVTS
jgi:hypothetical protein